MYCFHISPATTKLLLLVLLCLALTLCHLQPVSSNSNFVEKHSRSHYAPHGMRLPTRAFTAALRHASIDISHLGCGSSKSLVLLGMANEEALNYTVPYFLDSLSRVTITGGHHGGEPLERHVVIVAWSLDAMATCRTLQSQYSHQCVRDAQHTAATGSFSFHDSGFNSLG